MNSILLGKIFCKFYNDTYKTSLTSREIFRDVIAPLVFNNKRFLINWTNSKFFVWLKEFTKDENKFTKDEFKKRLDEFCEAVEKNETGLMTTMQVHGGCACDINSTTSFLFEENVYFTIEERYYSWIGSLFMLRVDGGYTIYINNYQYVKDMWESINEYRKFLENNDFIKGSQVETWNKIYIYEKINESYDPNVLVHKYTEVGKNDKNNELSGKNINFEKLIYMLIKHYGDIKYLYVSNVSKTNISSGVITVENILAKRTGDFLKKIFTEMGDDFKYSDFLKVIGGGKIFQKALETGQIKENMFKPSKDINLSEIKNKKNIKQIYNIYLDFVMNEELKNLANEFYKKFQNEREKEKKVMNFELKPIKDNTDFIERLSDLVKKYKIEKGIFHDIAINIVELSEEDFKLFKKYLIINFNF